MIPADHSSTYWRRLGDRLLDRLATAVSGIAFWTGIVVPLGYLPVLVSGVRTRGRFSLLLTLLVVHYVALVVGHSYNRAEL